MEIVGIGTSVVECVRVGRMIERYGERFLERVYTPHEVRGCRARRAPTEHYAGRWAAKQAVLQCLGLRGGRAVRWTDVEVRGDGPFRVYVGGVAKERTAALGIADVLVTIGHCRAYATAYAMAVRASARH